MADAFETYWAARGRKLAGFDYSQDKFSTGEEVPGQPVQVQQGAADRINPIGAMPVKQPQKKETPFDQIFQFKKYADPVFDQARVDRMKKVAKFNQIGRGIGVFGDILSTALGGNVNQREPDRVGPAMLQNYWEYLDKFEQMKERNRDRNTQVDNMNLRLMADEARRREAQQRYEQQQIEEKGWKDWQKSKYDQERLDRIQRDKDLAAQKEADRLNDMQDFKEKQDYVAKKNLQEIGARAAIAGKQGGQDGTGYDYALYDNSGNAIGVSYKTGELDKIVSMILADDVVATNIPEESKIRLLKQKDDPETGKAAMGMFAQEYALKSPAVMRYLMSRGGIPIKEGDPLFIGAPQPPQAQPRSQQATQPVPAPSVGRPSQAQAPAPVSSEDFDSKWGSKVRK